MLTLIIAAGLLVQQQFEKHLQEDYANTERELNLLSTLVQLHLQEGNYQYLEETLHQFGLNDPDIVELQLRAASGFNLASYQRQLSPEHPHHLQQTIDYSYRGNATLTVERDMAKAYAHRTQLIIQLLSGLIVVGALLGFLFYAIVLRQRETRLLLVKTHELDKANQALTAENIQRQHAEEALFDAKEHAEVTLQSIGDAVITTDTDGLVTQLNPVAQQLTGWTQADAIGQPLNRVFHIINSTTRQLVANPVEHVLATGQIVGLANHTSLIARNGAEHQIADSAAPILNKAGQTTGVVLVFHDVSEQYHQQAELASREVELRKITNILPGPVTRVDAEGRFVFVSDVYETWFGKRPEDVMGLTQLEAIGPELYSQFEPCFKRARAGETVSLEVSLPDSSHGKRHALFHVIPNIAEDGTMSGYYTIGIDITTLKQAEADAQNLREQLLQSTKMEAVGHLTAGIAHDFNNMLASIIGFTELTQQALATGASIQSAESYLTAIMKASNRAKELIAQMLTFSRKSPKTTDDIPVIKLSPVINEVVALLRSSIPSTIGINCNIADDNLHACIQDVHLHQIMVNLGINARDAVGEYGEIDISLSTDHSNNVICSSCRHRFSGDYAQITVHDNGKGISNDIISNVFDPFFTTKGVGKGTGMGLSVVHGLVHSANGHIHIDSSETGSTITILLPLATPKIPDEPAAPSQLTMPPELLADAHIMVVDDEPDIGNMLSETLNLQGAEVSVFTNPREALKAFENNSEKFDLVITDETMPGLSGMHLAKQMMAMKPALPVILYTGYSEHATQEAAEAYGLAGFFYKPLKMNELLLKLQQLIAKTKKH